MESKVKSAGRCTYFAAFFSLAGLFLLALLPKAIPHLDEPFFYQRHWWHHWVWTLPPLCVLATLLRMQRYRFEGFLPDRYVLPLCFSIAYVCLWALYSLMCFLFWANGFR